jgi:hypothetical protein
MRNSTAAVFGGLLLAVLVPFTGTAADAAATAGGVGCAAGAGVTVVVDFTDVGGDVEIGCAEGDPATGRQALIDAGFRATDSAPGMICAINSAPDPCPATFDGSYWSYWSAQPGETWSAYAVGADSSTPQSGAFEGWRYNDGASGPSLLPASVQRAGATAPSAEASPATTTTGPAGQAPSYADDQSASWVTTPVISVVVVALLGAAAVIARRRRDAHTPEPASDVEPRL